MKGLGLIYWTLVIGFGTTVSYMVIRQLIRFASKYNLINIESIAGADIKQKIAMYIIIGGAVVGLLTVISLVAYSLEKRTAKSKK